MESLHVLTEHARDGGKIEAVEVVQFEHQSVFRIQPIEEILKRRGDLPGGGVPLELDETILGGASRRWDACESRIVDDLTTGTRRNLLAEAIKLLTGLSRLGAVSHPVDRLFAGKVIAVEHALEEDGHRSESPSLSRCPPFPPALVSIVKEQAVDHHHQVGLERGFAPELPNDSRFVLEKLQAGERFEFLGFLGIQQVASADKRDGLGSDVEGPQEIFWR